MANVGVGGVECQERVNWDRLRKYRRERARERMKAHGRGAMLLMYDENVRYVTSTLTPGWNRLKPGLRYALLCGDDAPVLFEQGDIGAQVHRHSPWIPKGHVRWSHSWIKSAVMEARAVKNEDEQEALRIVGAIGDAAHWEFMKYLKPGRTENQMTAHIMEYLYSIPGMEDVEDVIV